MNNEIIIKTKGVTKAFDGVRAVDSLSVEIPQGKITGVIGPNGSGKTTLMNLLSGTLRIDGGSVVVSGVELERVVPHQLEVYGITRTFQNVRLFEQMSVLDNILVVLTEKGVIRSLFEKHGDLHINKAEEILQFIGLSGKRDDNAETLSYGQRKLLEIGRVLAMVDRGADIVLLDEPFAGLFPEMVTKVKDAISRLRSEGKTIILIEHSMTLIRELSDYTIVMDAGKLLAEGTPTTVLDHPSVIEAYLGE